MKHLLRMLSKTALRQKALMLAACLMLGSASAWAAGSYALVAWDETTGTLYFDYYDYSEAEPDYFKVPTVGSTWTTSLDETITISKFWKDDEVVNSGSDTPGWVTSDIQNACTKVVIGRLGDRNPQSFCRWFYGFKNLTSIEGLTNLKTKDVTDMSYMFAGCAKLTSLELIGFDTNDVETMTWMFSGCSSLTTLYLSTFNTSKVQDMQKMFSNCTSLKTIYVDENLWSTESVTNGTGMFSDCTSLVGDNKTAYSSGNTGLSYAHVDKADDPGYLTVGAVFVGWNDAWRELTIGFGKVPRLNYQNDDGVFTQVWYGKEVLDRPWRTDAVEETCTKVWFASSFTKNVKGLNLNYWFWFFSKLETVERFDYVKPGNTDHMFYDCHKLSSISLPSDLKRIGDCMFEGCISLTKIHIPYGVTSIGQSAFAGTPLTSINIPKTLTLIGPNAFVECPLAAYNVDEGHPCFASIDGVLFNADKTMLLEYPLGKTDEEYTVPDGVRSIGLGGSAFYGNQYLTSVILPNSVTTIDSYSFFYCEKLEKVKIYTKTPPVIDETVFEGIAKKSRLYVPRGSWSAYKNADYWKNFHFFYLFDIAYAIWDEKAKTLYFDMDHSKQEPVAGSKWETSSGRKVNVTKVWSDNEVEKTSSLDNPGWRQAGIIDECKKVVFENNIVPNNCHGWFDGFEQLTEIEGLHYLQTADVTDMSNMFAGCSRLRLDPKDLMRFDTENVTNMSGMFSGCSQLTELYLGSFNTKNVRSMDMMFANCTNLKAIYVDEGWWNTQQVTEASMMFNGCRSLVGGNGTAYDSANDGVGYARVDKTGEPGYLTAGTLFVVWCSGNSTLTFDFGAAPAEGSKYGGSTATNVIKGNEITYFISAKKWDAPWYDYGISGDCTRAVFTSAFAEHIKGLDMSFWLAGFYNLVLIQGFENVEVGSTGSMFYGCSNLSSITLPPTLKEIGNYMFECCRNLSSIAIPDGVTTIGERAFWSCDALTSINIPAGVSFIDEYAFSGCTSLSAFTVSNDNTHFTAVDGVLFTADKKTLVAYPTGKTATEYTVPSGVQRIGNGVFRDNSSLTSVILPGSLLAIGDYAFYWCEKLSAVKVFAKTPPVLGEDTFKEIASGATLYVPKGSKSAYENSKWSDYFTIKEFDMLPGDANGDGEVDVLDIVAITNYIAGVSNGDFYEDTADITGDGEVNIADVIAIANLILSD